MRMIKTGNGKCKLEGVVLWTAGTFRGFGSPNGGDKFRDGDLHGIVEAYHATNLDPRFYYGHPLNKSLSMLAKPKGNIVDMYVSGKKVLGDIENVPVETAKEAISDNVRLSPDMRHNYVDPATGEEHKWVITGLAMLGAVSPGNKLVPALGDQLLMNPDHHYMEAHRAYAAANERSFVLDFSDRFHAANPSVQMGREIIADRRSFAMSMRASSGRETRTRKAEREGIMAMFR